MRILCILLLAVMIAIAGALTWEMAMEDTTFGGYIGACFPPVAIGCAFILGMAFNSPRGESLARTEESDEAAAG